MRESWICHYYGNRYTWRDNPIAGSFDGAGDVRGKLQAVLRRRLRLATLWRGIMITAVTPLGQEVRSVIGIDAVGEIVLRQAQD